MKSLATSALKDDSYQTLTPQHFGESLAEDSKPAAELRKFGCNLEPIYSQSAMSCSGGGGGGGIIESSAQPASPRGKLSLPFISSLPPFSGCRAAAAVAAVSSGKTTALLDPGVKAEPSKEVNRSTKRNFHQISNSPSSVSSQDAKLFGNADQSKKCQVSSAKASQMTSELPTSTSVNCPGNLSSGAVTSTVYEPNGFSKGSGSFVVYNQPMAFPKVLITSVKSVSDNNIISVPNLTSTMTVCDANQPRIAATSDSTVSNHPKPVETEVLLTKEDIQFADSFIDLSYVEKPSGDVSSQIIRRDSALYRVFEGCKTYTTLHTPPTVAYVSSVPEESIIIIDDLPPGQEDSAKQFHTLTAVPVMSVPVYNHPDDC